MSDELTSMVEAGMTVPQIAEELGKSVGTIKKMLADAGLEAHSRAKPAFNISRILEQYGSGVSVAQIISEQPGLTYTKFYGILSNEGVPTRKVEQEHSRARQLDEAVELYIQGLKIFDIVQETGVAQPTLHAELHARGVPLRKARKPNARSS